MPRKKTMEQCGCSGCDRPVKCSGLCNAHYTRWIAAKKPPMDTFLADKALGGPIGRSSPRQYRIHQRRQLQAAAPSPPAPRPSGAVAREAITPAAVPEPQAPSNGHGLGVFTHIVLAEPATGILIGRVGQFITIADARGRVLHQMPAA
jgi:hypothetical protein